MEKSALPKSVKDITRPVTPLDDFVTAPKKLPWAEHMFGTRKNTFPESARTIRALTERLGPIAHMRQVHGDRIVHAEGSGLYEECDALITTNAAQEDNLWIAVKTADCVPVLISSQGVVAAVHAGWRGLSAGIIGKVAQEIQSAYGINPEDLHLAIGPCISQSHYEVDHTFLETFERKFFNYDEAESTQKPKLNLAAVARQQALDAGLPAAQVHTVGRCTYAEPATFNSYRRARQHNEPDYAVNVSLIRVRPR